MEESPLLKTLRTTTVNDRTPELVYYIGESGVKRLDIFTHFTIVERSFLQLLNLRFHTHIKDCVVGRRTSEFVHRSELRLINLDPKMDACPYERGQRIPPV